MPMRARSAVVNVTCDKSADGSPTCLGAFSPLSCLWRANLSDPGGSLRFTKGGWAPSRYKGMWGRRPR